MDKLGYLSFWIGVVAFMLSIPMSNTANMLTRRVEASWATTSNKRRDRRIKKLKLLVSELTVAMSMAKRHDSFVDGFRLLAFGFVYFWGFVFFACFMFFGTFINLLQMLGGGQHYYSIMPKTTQEIADGLWPGRTDLIPVILPLFLSLVAVVLAINRFTMASRSLIFNKLRSTESELESLLFEAKQPSEQLPPSV
jgi:hypothetical protein